MMIEVVFFDAGETLLRPHPSFPELFATVCQREGRDIDPSDVSEVQDRLAPYLVDLAHDTGVEHPSLSPEGSRIFWIHLYTRFLGELGIADDELAAELFATFSSTSSYKLFDDVLPALRQLQNDGYRLGLISNFEEWLEEMLVELEVGDFFETRIISGRAGVEKPDPAIYRLALDSVGVEADLCVHVGDSPYLDIEPATSVGMKAILIDRKDRHADATVPRIRSLEDLAETVANLKT